MLPFIIQYDLTKLSEIADRIVALLPVYQVFIFVGDLGAGKTALIRALLARCGIHEPVTSPTFNYVNCYVNADGQQFYHFDLYRIADEQQFMMLGLNEFLYRPNAWAFIEWPDAALPFLANAVCMVNLERTLIEDERVITITKLDETTHNVHKESDL